ncbi:MAG: DUF5131 family protein [Phycisphaerales bacterium]
MSKIEWTECTWNPLVGCTPVSPGCLNCYAATMARRLEAMGRPEYAPREEPLTAAELRGAHAAVGGGKLYEHERVKEVRIAEVKGGRAVFTGEVRLVPERLAEPLRWKKPRMCFVNSMSDLFHESVPFEYIDKVFAVMKVTPHVTYQVLTKRPARMAEYLTHWPNGMDRGHHIALQLNARGDALRTGEAGDGTGPRVQLPLPNVWLGASVEDQPRADERIPHLLKCPAAVLFLSVEPLLGKVDLTPFLRALAGVKLCRHCGYRTNRDERWCPNSDIANVPLVPDSGIDWVIVGGESGGQARGCDMVWVRSIVKQCKAAGVPCFVKQLGAKPYAKCKDCTCVDTEVRYNRLPFSLGCDSALRLNDRKGGDMAEWPADLWVREWPLLRGGAGAAAPASAKARQ